MARTTATCLRTFLQRSPCQKLHTSRRGVGGISNYPVGLGHWTEAMQAPAEGSLLKLCPRTATLRLEASIRRRDGHNARVVGTTVGYYGVHASVKAP
jgi:hypothetical protein